MLQIYFKHSSSVSTADFEQVNKDAKTTSIDLLEIELKIQVDEGLISCSFEEAATGDVL